MYKSKTKPFAHQKKALELSALKANFAYFMEMGCVDGETEFLTQRGWVKFKDFNLQSWERPLLVAQAEPSKDPWKWALRFVEPEAYIKKESDDWYEIRGGENTSTDTAYQHIEVRRGTGKLPRAPFMFTGEHELPLVLRWVSYRNKGNTCRKNKTVNVGKEKHVDRISVKTLYDISYRLMEPSEEYPAMLMTPHYGPNTRMYYASEHIENGHKGFDSKYFNIDNNEIAQLTPDELRFMVAVAADGTYPNVNNNKVDFYLMKKRKVDRLIELAAKAGIRMVHEIKWRERGAAKHPVHVFHCIAPVRCKVFDEKWYSLNGEQLKAIASEVFFWDGHTRASDAEFYTIHKKSADFIQYALMVSGWSAALRYSATKKLYCVRSVKKRCSDPSIIPPGMDTPEPEYRAQLDRFINLDWETFKKVETKQTAYCFRVPSGYLILRRSNQIIITGNSGKTKVMLDNIGVLYDKGAIDGAIVLAPKGVYQNWSEKEIPTHVSDDIEKEVLVWDAASSEGRKRALAKQIDSWNGKSLQFMVFNIESLISKKGKEMLEKFIKKHKGKVLCLVDESTCIKNHKAKRTKEAINIGKKCIARRIATGSPVTNSPLDLYSQCAFLSKSLLGFGSYYSFKSTYADIERVQNRQGQSYDKILRYKNLDNLSDKLEKFSFRVTKKECLDLPDKIYVTRNVELTPEQRVLYKEMADNQLAFIEREGQLHEMSAQVVLTKLLRLHQILCGTFTTDEGEVKDIPNNRIEVLKEVLEDTSGKVIIWAAYLNDIKQISQMLKKEYGIDSYVTYFGATSQADRTEAINLFQDPDSGVRFFLGNVQTAGRGITLTAASTVIYYSNNFSLELRQQSEDRAHRLGQVNKVTYVDLVVRHTMDEKIIKSLVEKRNIANEILKDDLEDWISISGA